MTNSLALVLLLAPQQDHPELRKVHEAVRASFVPAEILLRKKTRLEKADQEDEAQDSEAQRLQQLAESGQPLETWGVAVAKDLVLMPDRGFAQEDVEKITLTDATGATFGGTLAGLGRNHDFILVKASAPHALAPIAFSEWAPPALGESFHATYAERVDHRWHLNVSPYIQTNAPLDGRKDWFCIDLMRAGSVVSDKAGNTVGIALDQYLWVSADGRSSFLGRGILDDERVAGLEARYEGFRKALPSVLRRVELTFRADRPADRFAGPEEGASGRAVVFGVVVDDRGTLFVPEDLSRDQVRKIEEIRVTDGGQVRTGTFVGSFQKFGGFLVRAEGLAARAGIATDAKAFPPGALFFTATVEDRFGRDRIKLASNRLFRTESGLEGAPRVQPRKRVRGASFLLDFEGRVVGCATVDRKEEDIDEMALEAVRDRYYSRYRNVYAQDHLRRLLFFSEVAALLAAPAAHFDPKAVPMSKKDEKRLVWLGAEFQEVSKPLAEALGIQERDLTNDGRRGLVVTEVYAGSPAAKAGLVADDVLLSVQAEGDAAPRDLVAEPDRFAYARSGPPGMRGAPAPWKPAKNYLTTMLTEVGAEKKVLFDVLRGKEKRRVPLVLEYAPRDYESAERHKDDDLGFTVKELTYEVRHFQKLEPGVHGVVVAKVESGTKADVAKLQVHAVICRVNEEPVRDLEHFKALVAKAGGLTLTTVSYGQSRLVELGRD